MEPRKLLLILMAVVGLSLYSAWLAGQKMPAAAQSSIQTSVPYTDIPLLTVKEAEALWHNPSTIFLDVRTELEYVQGHIQGAIWLPEDDFDKHFPALKARLEKARAIVVYCKSRDCGKSLWAGLRLRQQGLDQVRIYPAGWNEWSYKGLPSEGIAND
jgi:rhodanese-related sulfurtransferase